MLLEPVPGIDLQRLRQTLMEVRSAMTSAQMTRRTPADLHLAYIQWVSDAVSRLSLEVATRDLERLVLTRRSWLLQSLTDVGDSQPARVLINTEFNQQIMAFDAAIKAIDAEITRWQQPGVLVIPDSSFYITHPDQLEQVHFGQLLSVREKPVRLIVPMAIVDELDRLKESGNKHVRWRATYTLAVLDRVLQSPSTPAILSDEDFSALNEGGIPRGRVTIEVMFDPPGHARLPITDDEIVSRAFAAQNRRGRDATLVTYDTGQATRARHAGLHVVKLSIPVEPAD